MRVIDEECLRCLSNSPIFSGIAADKRGNLLHEMGAYVRSYKEGEFVFRSGDVLHSILVVVRGEIEARMITREGVCQVLATFAGGDSFAEALPLSNMPAPVEAISQCTSCILFIPAASLTGVRDPIRERLYANVTSEMSKKISMITDKLAILSEPHVRDRVIMYLQRRTPDADGYITLPFSRKVWAGYLCVNDKALLRELSRMRQEGLLEGEGRHVRLTIK